MCSSAFRVLAPAPAAGCCAGGVDVGAAAAVVMTFARVFAVRWRCQNATDTDESLCPLASPARPRPAHWRASVDDFADCGLLRLQILWLVVIVAVRCPLAAAWHVC